MTVNYISNTVHIVCTIECTMYVQRAHIETNGDPTPGLLKRASTTTQRHPQHTHCTFNTTQSAETPTIQRARFEHHTHTCITTHHHHHHAFKHHTTDLHNTPTTLPTSHTSHEHSHYTVRASNTTHMYHDADLYNGHIARTLGATICPTCFCEKDDKANAQWILLTNTHNHQIKIHDNKNEYNSSIHCKRVLQ